MCIIMHKSALEVWYAKREETRETDCKVTMNAYIMASNVCMCTSVSVAYRYALTCILCIAKKRK